ncbi:MAG TPA: formylglycine-generating enzyme family protein [Paludibacter sp.]
MGLLSNLKELFGDTSKKPTIEWVDIPAGTYIMGIPESEYCAYNYRGYHSNIGYIEFQHQVTLSSFKMSKYAVTFKQYDIFCKAIGKNKPSDNGWGRNQLPVINVSLRDAKAFANWMGCRLPTEAEWEYGCRAGTTTPFNTGKILSFLPANYEHQVGKTMPVGSYPPNGWGLYDMHGNVSEWCDEGYNFSGYPTIAQIDPMDKLTFIGLCVIRGGSYRSMHYECRSGSHDYHDYDSGSSSIGFRIVLPS